MNQGCQNIFLMTFLEREPYAKVFLMLKVYLLYEDTKDCVLTTETGTQDLRLVIEDRGLEASALPLFFCPLQRG